MDTALKVATRACFTRDGLIARYALSEGAGTASADNGPNGYALALAASTAAPTWAAPYGLTGDGTNDYAVATLPSTTLAGLTIEVVFKTTTALTDKRMGGVGNTSGVNGSAYIRTSGTVAGKLEAGITNDAGSGTLAANAATVNDGNPHYAAAAWGANYITLHVDETSGTPAGMGGAITITRASVLALVRNTTVGFFPGTVLAFAIYDRALTSDERARNRAAYQAQGIL
jgi:hypothetical protein